MVAASDIECTIEMYCNISTSIEDLAGSYKLAKIRHDFVYQANDKNEKDNNREKINGAEQKRPVRFLAPSVHREPLRDIPSGPKNHTSEARAPLCGPSIMYYCLGGMRGTGYAKQEF